MVLLYWKFNVDKIPWEITNLNGNKTPWETAKLNVNRPPWEITILKRNVCSSF
jgi:hypothetical protein